MLPSEARRPPSGPTRRGGAGRAAAVARLCLVEARPQVQGVFLLRFAVGAALAAPGATAAGATAAEGADPGAIVVGAMAWWCAVVCVYLLNGVTDVAEDRANASRRPVARGDLPVRTAARVTAALAATALCLAAGNGVLLGWTAAFLALGWVYSAPPVAAKRWSVSCSAAVFGLGWTGYVAGAAVSGHGLTRTGLVFAAAMSAWMALVGAVVKDLADADGDAVGGRRTLAALRGPGAARRMAVTGAALVGAGAPLASLAVAPAALPGTVPLAAGAVWVVVECLRLDTTGPGDRRARRGGYRAFMTTQYAANSAMLTTVLAGEWG